MLYKMKNQHKRRLNFKGTLEYLEFTWAHVDEFVFVGGLVVDRNEGQVVALRGSVRHFTCMARMQVVFIPINAHFPFYGDSFLYVGQTI